MDFVIHMPIFRPVDFECYKTDYCLGWSNLSQG